jgi:hypothetical protein
VLQPQFAGRDAFHFLEHIGGGRGRPGPDEQMDVIGLDRQLLDMPSVLSALGLDQGFTVDRDFSGEDGLTTLRTPDQVVDDQVDTVFVALVLHVDIANAIDTAINSVAKNQQAEAREEDRLTTATEVAWLAAG